MPIENFLETQFTEKSFKDVKIQRSPMRNTEEPATDKSK